MLLDMRVERLIQERFSGHYTEVQKQAIPLINNGENVLVMAPTGQGKTESALLPLLSKILKNDKLGVQLLYITPLKALNRDMMGRVEWWCDRLGITKSLRHGDTSQYERSKQSKKPPQVLITTPETFNAILVNKYLGSALKNVKYVIIDEIHELVESKRGVQLSMTLERLNLRSKHKIQRIGLSATVGAPELIAKYLSPNKPIRQVYSMGNKQYDIKIIYPTKKNVKAKINAGTLKKLKIDPEAIIRIIKLKEILRNKKSLIFVNTRSSAEALSSRLNILGLNVEVHHGSLSKDSRLKAENNFKQSKTNILICTSSMELGIDIGDIDQVIQYVSPRQVRRLTQRVGRAGHHHSKISKGTILTVELEDYIESLSILKLFEQDWLEPERIQKNSYDVIAQQVIGILLETVHGFHEYPMTFKKIHNILKRSYVYEINKETLTSILTQLQRARLIITEELGEDIKIIPRTLKARIYYYTNLSTIPYNHTFLVRDIILNKKIGKLDEKFVGVLGKGEKFITKGVPWKVVDITNDEVLVEGIQDYSMSIPDWIGEELPVSYEIAQMAGRIRQEIKSMKQFGELSGKLANDLVPIPTDETIVIESTPEKLVIHTCAGNRVNETLAKILSSNIAEKFGRVRTSSDQYRIFIETSLRIKSDEIKNILKSLGNVKFELQNAIPETSSFNYELNHVAKLFGVIQKDETISRKLAGYLTNTAIYNEAINSITYKYYDVENAERFLHELRNKKIECFDHVELSLWAKLGMTENKFGDVLGKIEPQKEVIEIFMKNILQRRVKLKCTYCNNVWFNELDKLSNNIKCAKCGSPMIGLGGIFREDRYYEKKDDYVLQTAPIIKGYGKKGVIALTVYGVGPKTASRILRLMRKDNKKFFMDLIDAQKSFIKNKRFWTV